MKTTRLLAVCLLLGPLLSASGCLVPKSQLTGCRSQNRILSEQCRAQLAEIENLKTHSRNVEDQLIRTEEELALLQEEVGLDHRQLANYQRERAELHEQFKGLANGCCIEHPLCVRWKYCRCTI